MRWSFNKVLEALKNIEKYKSYYIDSSLCIDFKYGPHVVLNTNGRGFFYAWPNERYSGGITYMRTQTATDDLNREIHFIMTREMEQLVKKHYRTYKMEGK
jgi:hypothetical protein